MNVLVSLWLMVQPGVTAAFVVMPSDSLLPQVHMAENAFFLGFCGAVQNTEPVQTTWLKSVEVVLWIMVGLGLSCVFLGSGCCIGGCILVCFV